MNAFHFLLFQTQHLCYLPFLKSSASFYNIQSTLILLKPKISAFELLPQPWQTQRGVAVETIVHLAVDEARAKRNKDLLTKPKKSLKMNLSIRVLEKELLA